MEWYPNDFGKTRQETLSWLLLELTISNSKLKLELAELMKEPEKNHHSL